MQKTLPSRKEIKKIFDSILTIDDVKGIILCSFQGEIIFEEFLLPLPEHPDSKVWWCLFIDSLKGVREADLVFEKNRLYIRRTEYGYLFVLMGVFAPMAMLRLNCDTLLPNLKRPGGIRGLKYLFKG